MSELKLLMTQEEHDALKVIAPLLPIVKAKWFSLGRDMVKLEKAFAVFGKETDAGSPKAVNK